METAFVTEDERRALLLSRGKAAHTELLNISSAYERQAALAKAELEDLLENGSQVGFPVALKECARLAGQLREATGISADKLLSRLYDIMDIAEAKKWPLPWYAVPSEEVTAESVQDLRNMLTDYAMATARADGAAIAAMYLDPPLRPKMTGSTVCDHWGEPTRQMVPCSDFEIRPRFDGRVVALGSTSAPPFYMLELEGDPRDNIHKKTPLTFVVVRTIDGWRFA